MKPKEPCLLPWIELHVNTLGQLKTCCAQFDFLENNQGKPFKEVFNEGAFSKLRAEFLSGQTPKVCEACVKAEAGGLSYKSVKSPQWSHYAAEILNPENQTRKFPVRFLDVRFGNLCNFACRTCDSDNSSKWQRIDGDVGRSTVKVTRVPNSVLREQIFAVLDEVEEIYFAGGEPLLNEDHYLVLEEIIRRKKTSVKITYNTNLSVLKGYGRDVVQLWERLENVIVYPSIDSIGAQGEYIRTGFKWNEFEENYQKIKKYVGCLHSVLSAYNVFSIQELIRWAHSNGSLLSIFPAYHPVEISASVLPEATRKKAAAGLRQLVVANSFNDWQLSQINTAIQFLLNNFTPEYTGKFSEFNRRLDLHHKTDFLSVFPEHSDWLGSFKP